MSAAHTHYMQDMQYKRLPTSTAMMFMRHFFNLKGPFGNTGTAPGLQWHVWLGWPEMATWGCWIRSMFLKIKHKIVLWIVWIVFATYFPKGLEHLEHTGPKISIDITKNAGSEPKRRELFRWYSCQLTLPKNWVLKLLALAMSHHKAHIGALWWKSSTMPSGTCLFSWYSSVANVLVEVNGQSSVINHNN